MKKRIITVIAVIMLAAIFATGCRKAPDPIVNPSTEPSMNLPDTTIPATTETLPNDSFETDDGTGTTTPDVTEPEVTTPVATTPVVTTPVTTTPEPTTKPTEPETTEPVATTPKPTEPTTTTPAPTEPVVPTTKPTEHTHSYTSKVTKAATCTSAGVKTFTCSCGESYTEAIAKLGHTYSSKVTKEATCTEAGTRTFSCACGHAYTETIAKTGHNYETKVVAPTTSAQGYTLYTCKNCGDNYKSDYTNKLPAETEPSDEFGGVTPDNISVSNTAGWTDGKFQLFRMKYWNTMTTAQKRAYFLACFDGGYDCGVEGHDCLEASDHRPFTKACAYCGLMDCPDRICKDEYGFTYCDETKCSSYDVKLDPSKYCQTCGKPTSPTIEPDPTKKCTQKIGNGGPCVYCGVMVPGHTCHTCKQEDIDAYN